MIVVNHWIATIPGEDKHLAYRGEHDAFERYFFIPKAESEPYQLWNFYLDLAFDLSTVTSISTHEQQITQETQNETASDTAASLTASTTTEKRAVTAVQVDSPYTTDVASLSKEWREDGLLLTWRVLRQHTLLPGKLRATLRAIDESGRIKKSAMMVFEVAPSVEAEPAAPIPMSEFEVMEQRMVNLTNTVESGAAEAQRYVADCKQSYEEASIAADSAVAASRLAAEAISSAETSAEVATAKAASAVNAADAAYTFAKQASASAEIVNEAATSAATATAAADTAVGARDEVQAMLGDMNTALDTILSLQQELIGGAAA